MWWTILCWVVGVCHALMALLLPWNRWRTTPLERDPTAGADCPSVLIVVPARNEETNIEACVRSLLAQDYPRMQVCVVDDQSTDRTAAIVRALAASDPRLELRQSPPLPAGWLGKPHALDVGTRGGKADYFLFIDADVRLQPSTLRRSIASAQKSQAGLLTVTPTLIAESFWERAAQPVIGMLLYSLLDPVKVRNPDSSVAAAYGPYLLFKRSAYEKIGGHGSVAMEVIEDLRLAQIVKQARLGLGYVHGVDGVDLRMYDSLRALVNGWRKNFHIVLGQALWISPLAAIAVTLVFTLPTVAIAVTGLRWLIHCSLDAASALPAVFCYLADWLARISLHRNFRITWRGSRALGGLVVAYILCSSSYRAWKGKPVTWRGRSYAQGGGAQI
jgi:cellulose synthase/poly-beta-1,6-N-acetylglucosamine synthase-like glycosyltransferase